MGVSSGTARHTTATSDTADFGGHPIAGIAKQFENNGYTHFSPLAQNATTKGRYKQGCGESAMLWLQTNLASGTSLIDKEWNGSQGVTIDVDWTIENIWTKYTIHCHDCDEDDDDDGDGAPDSAEGYYGTPNASANVDFDGRRDTRARSETMFVYDNVAVVVNALEGRDRAHYVFDLGGQLQRIDDVFQVRLAQDSGFQFAVVHRAEDGSFAISIFESFRLTMETRRAPKILARSVRGRVPAYRMDCVLRQRVQLPAVPGAVALQLSSIRNESGILVELTCIPYEMDSEGGDGLGHQPLAALRYINLGGHLLPVDVTPEEPPLD